ncbi:hypothetical protein NDU88_003021 [Pleurodeles waltl]|uniref:Uncharacterized protein n=1 Tax=Pleurodeles waltl TaxID=8319 RepID=A0AAV7RCP6_PLEWA|nr:hypothetical protein NDU88_003021 [Pleurodeles waltl]
MEVSLASASGPQSQSGPRTHPVFFSPGSASRGPPACPVALRQAARSRPSWPSVPLCWVRPPLRSQPGRGHRGVTRPSLRATVSAGA